MITGSTYTRQQLGQAMNTVKTTNLPSKFTTYIQKDVNAFAAELDAYQGNTIGDISANVDKAKQTAQAAYARGVKLNHGGAYVALAGLGILALGLYHSAGYVVGAIATIGGVGVEIHGASKMGPAKHELARAEMVQARLQDWGEYLAATQPQGGSLAAAQAVA